MYQFVINYLTVDSIASVFVFFIMYARRREIKAALRIYLEIPAPCHCPEPMVESEDYCDSDLDSDDYENENS